MSETENTQQVAVREANVPSRGTYARPLTIRDIKEQVNLLQEVMREVMQPGLHYGHIPGTPEGQLALYKEGAEKLGLTFRLAPRFPKDRQEVKELQNGHREYVSFCEIRHIQTGEVWAEIGRSCSTMESKYRWRNAARQCPACNKETIRKGSEKYGGGWFCAKNSGGCGAKFKTGDRLIEGQEVGKVENQDIADLYNTCLGMSQKRAHVASMKLALACSDIFRQSAYEVDDEPESEGQFEEVEDDKPQKQAKTPQEKTLKTEEKNGHANTAGDLLTDDEVASLNQAITDAGSSVTPGKLKLFLHKTYGVDELKNLSTEYQEGVYQWITQQMNA